MNLRPSHTNRSTLPIVVFFFLILFNVPAFSQFTTDSVYNYHTEKGINAVYNLDFQNAKTEFQQLVRLKPDHPAGQFFLAMIEWWKIMIDLDNESNDERFIALLDKVIDLCDKRLDDNEDDLTALFFKGGSLGFQGRLYANREDWVKAANNGRLALPIVQDAYRLAPTNNDVLLGIGIYNFYAAVIPEQYLIVKPLMIFFPDGDKPKGMLQLRQASENSRYADVEATYFLMQIMYQYEKNYKEALTIASKLLTRFPNNVVFQKYVGRCHAANGNWDEMYLVFQDMLAKVTKHQTGYTPAVQREAEYYLGLHDMATGVQESALKHFYKTDELSRSLDKNGPSGFMIMSNLKVGMIYDMQDKREIAIRQYDKVLNMKDYQNSHSAATRYKKQAYGK